MIRKFINIIIINLNHKMKPFDLLLSRLRSDLNRDLPITLPHFRRLKGGFPW